VIGFCFFGYLENPWTPKTLSLGTQKTRFNLVLWIYQCWLQKFFSLKLPAVKLVGIFAFFRLVLVLVGMKHLSILIVSFTKYGLKLNPIFLKKF